MTETQPLLAFCTCPDTGSAERLAGLLVERRLAACVNVLPALTSIYRWQDAVEKNSEALMIIKTTDARWDSLRDTLQAAHPYDVPEIIASPITHGSAPYLEWLRSNAQEVSPCAG